MEIRHKIDIDLLQFFKTGEFDFIKIGQSKEWIRNNFPEPDDFGLGSSLDKSTIWRYGSIEFHFQSDKLISIFSDHIKSLSGGKNIHLNKWILSNLENLEFHQFVSELLNEEIDFDLRHLKNTNQIGVKLPSSNIEIRFDKDDGQFVLSSFYLGEG